MLKNSRSLRNLREPVKEKASCARMSTAPGPASARASPCSAAAGSRTRRTLAGPSVRSSGLVRWAPGGRAAARSSVPPAAQKLLGPQLLPFAWKPSQAWVGTAAQKDGLSSCVENELLSFGVLVSPSCWDVPWN